MPYRLAILSLIAAATFQGTRPTTPESTKISPIGTSTTLPANTLHSGDNSATYDIEQDDQTIVPDLSGIYHLHRAPFALHLHGDIDDVAVTASHNDKLITALAAEKRPILTLIATGCAYDVGDLLVNDESALVPFDTFKTFFGNDAPMEEKLLKARVGAMPVVLDSSIEYSTAFAPPNATEYVQKIDTLLAANGSLFAASSTQPSATGPATPLPKLDWQKETDLYLTLLINSPAEVAKFKHAALQGVHVRFDLK